MKRISTLLFIVFLSGCAGNSGEKISLPFNGSKWELRSGIYEKKPISIRINRGLEKHQGSLRYQAAASVSIKRPLADGMPDESEKASLRRMEAILLEKLERPGLAVFALEVMSDKTCDFIFYTNRKKEVDNVFSEMKAMIGDCTVAFTIQRDDAWRNYEWFLSYVVHGMWGGL